MRQSFMVARIITSNNPIFGMLLLNELNTILSPRYLLIKFETNKEITFIRSDQVEARRGFILVGKAVIKQPEEDKQRKSRTKPRGEPVKIELDG